MAAFHNGFRRPVFCWSNNNGEREASVAKLKSDMRRETVLPFLLVFLWTSPPVAVTRIVRRVESIFQ